MAVVDVVKARLFPLCAVILLGLSGCSKVIVRQRPPAPLSQAWALAVYPVTFLFPVTPYESYVRGRSVAEDLSLRTNCQVFGPGEFRVLSADDDDLRKATTIASVAHYSPERPPQGLYAIRTTVNRLVSRGEASTLTDKSGQARGQREADQATDVSVRVELVSMGSRAVVAQVEGNAHVDGLRDASLTDRYPEITALTRSLIDSLLEISGFTPNRAGLEPQLRVVPVLAPALTFAAPGAASLQSEISRLDALDREAKLLTLVKQSDPTAPRARQRIIQSAPSGMVVAAVSPAATKAGLRVDDLILSVNDEPIVGRFTLDRALRQGATRLQIKRGSDEQEVTLNSDAKTTGR